jgi:hypothetical protein
MHTDLSGKNVLLSNHFYYFGNNARRLPRNLAAIAQNQQGHRVKLNAPFVPIFLRWLESLELKPNKLYGRPGSHTVINCGHLRAKDAKKVVCASC